jgi:peptidoglycan/LPS O-acetylase OafA/YrhL
MTPAITSKPERSGALDLLRFLAVLIVFFSHYTDTYNYVYHIVPSNLKYMPIFHYGSTALIVFFMVSGYVVTMTSVKKDLREFLVTRLSRIYPLFWVSCIVAFILPRIIQEHTYLLHSSFKTFLINMTMVPALFGHVMINPIYHTLLVELAFYFFIAIIIAFNLWNRILIIISILVLYCLYKSFDESASAHVFIPPFVAGMLFYFIKAKRHALWKLNSLLILNYICSLDVGRVLIRQMGEFYKNPAALNIWTMSIIITAIYLLFYLIVADKMKVKNTRITQILGEIAYPFYLFHIYFLFIYWYFRNSLSGELLLFGILATIVLICWAINIYIEKPLSRLAAQVLKSFFGMFTKAKINTPELTSSSESI